MCVCAQMKIKTLGFISWHFINMHFDFRDSPVDINKWLPFKFLIPSHCHRSSHHFSHFIACKFEPNSLRPRFFTANPPDSVSPFRQQAPIVLCKAFLSLFFFSRTPCSDSTMYVWVVGCTVFLFSDRPHCTISLMWCQFFKVSQQRSKKVYIYIR